MGLYSLYAMTEAHKAFKWSNVPAKDGKRFMRIGESLRHPDNISQAHKEALADPRQPDV